MHGIFLLSGDLSIKAFGFASSLSEGDLLSWKAFRLCREPCGSRKSFPPLGAQARAAGEKAGFSLARDTENGPEWVAFSAALQYDYNINYLTLTPEQAEPFYKRNRSA